MDTGEIWTYSYAVWGWHKHTNPMPLTDAKEQMYRLRWYWPGGVAVLPATGYEVGDYHHTLPYAAIAAHPPYLV